MSSIYIMRARYQPFTRYHYEAMCKLILSRREDFEKGSVLVVAVVRDYETIIRKVESQPQRVVEGFDFRHLPLFNPLSLFDICRDVTEGVWHFLDPTGDGRGLGVENFGEDSVDEFNEADRALLRRVFSQHLMIWPLHFRFSELADILSGKAKNANKPCELLVPLTVPGNKNSGYSCGMHYSVIDALSWDESSGIQKRVWYFPMFDSEDHTDMYKTRTALRDEVIGGKYKVAPKRSIRIGDDVTPTLGLYGIFAAHAFLLLYGRRNPQLADDARYKRQMKLLGEFIEKNVSPAGRVRYFKRLEKMVSQVDDRLREAQIEGGATTEAGIYANPASFRALCGATAIVEDEDELNLAMTIQIDCKTLEIHLPPTVKKQLGGQLDKFEGWLERAKRGEKPYCINPELLSDLREICGMVKTLEFDSVPLTLSQVEILGKIAAAADVDDVSSDELGVEKIRKVLSELRTKRGAHA